MIRARATLAILAAIALLVSHPSNADPRDAVGKVLETFRETYGFPGATVAWARSGGSVDTIAVGFADLEARETMRPDHRMLAASIGKTIWGALVLALESDGLLAQDDRVADHLGHLPWFDRVPNAATMTIGQLLRHSAGLPDHVQMDGAARDLIAIAEADTFDPSRLVAFILDEPPLFPPGTGWAYSDTGYVILGLVIEAATWRGVFDLARERFLVPLGLKDTLPSDAPKLAQLAVGYTDEGNPFGLPPRTITAEGDLAWNPVVEWTGGGFASTSRDLAIWGQALFSGGAFESPYLDRLLDGPSVHPDAPGIFYGTGVAIYRNTPHGPVYGHGGWIPGYVSSLRHYADHGLTVAFQINTDLGVVDDSTDLVPALEAALAETLLEADPK